MTAEAQPQRGVQLPCASVAPYLYELGPLDHIVPAIRWPSPTGPSVLQRSEYGRRLAGMLPNARLVELPDSYTLVPLDQLAALARAQRVPYVRKPLPKGLGFMDGKLHFAVDLYQGTAEYYDRFRLPYPEAMTGDLIARTGVRGQGRLLDLACGTGQLTFPLRRSFAEVWAVDREPGFAQLVQAKAGKLGAENIRPVAADAETLDAELLRWRLHASLECGGPRGDLGTDQEDGERLPSRARSVRPAGRCGLRGRHSVGRCLR